MRREKLIALAERIKHTLDQAVSDDEVWLRVIKLQVQEMILDIVVSPQPAALLGDLRNRQRDGSYEDVVSALNEHPEFDPKLAQDILNAFDSYRKL
jgi:hypothetical protein